MNKARWQISLGTFLLIVVVIALATSHIITSRQLAFTQQELAKYRYEYGHLVIDDPSRPHVLCYANQENPWKWHVNFPEGKNYKMMSGVGDIPITGPPDVTRLQHLQETSITGTGENITMTVSLSEYKPDSLKFSIGCDGAQTVAQVIPREDVFTSSVFNSFSIGSADVFVADPDKAFVLFYRTEPKSNLTGGSAGSANGVVVWVVPVKQN